MVGGALALGSCGGSTPSGPSAPPAAAVVSGGYLLQIQPAPGCAFPAGVLSFPMEAASAGGYPHPGVRVVLEGAPGSLEGELLYLNSTLPGGLGTTGDRVLSSEGLRVWVRAIGTGPVTAWRDGRGEVATGTLLGYLAIGGANACAPARPLPRASHRRSRPSPRSPA